MRQTHLRQAATIILQCAIRLAPEDAREWGEGMSAELSYVEGEWAVVMWALGGASVMAKRALLAIFIPRRQDVEPDDVLFAKEVSLGRVALVAGAGCSLVALLFFASPPFRQAFRVAMRPWSVLFRTASGDLQPTIEALAKKAEARHDPEGIAFCAVRLADSHASARLAEEAIRMDRNFLWVYAVVAMRHPELPQVSQWMEELEKWDAQNALFPLVEADSIVRTRFRGGSVWAPPNQDQDQAWQSAMAAAFQSPKFDDYMERVAGLNRRVVPRYAFYDPYEVESRVESDLPGWGPGDFERFANLLLQSGADLEARGDRKAARDKYWVVARFGQVIDSEGHTDLEHRAGTYLQAIAYRRLRTLSEQEGSSNEAAHFAYLARKFDGLGAEREGNRRESAFGFSVSKRNAAVVEISGLMILVFSVLVVIATTILIAVSLQAGCPAGGRVKPMATFLVFASSLGLLFSSVTLYVTYRPYWYIFQNALASGGVSQAGDFRNFLMATQSPPGLSPRGFYVLLNAFIYSGSPSFLFYVWAGVTLLGVIGLVFILLRHLLGRPSSGGLHPRVP